MRAHRSRELGLTRQQRGGSEQHADVTIMATGVHDAIDRVRQTATRSPRGSAARRYRPARQSLVASFAAGISASTPSAGDVFAMRDPEIIQELADSRSGTCFFPAQFRMAVKFAPHLHDLCEQSLIEKVHGRTLAAMER